MGRLIRYKSYRCLYCYMRILHRALPSVRRIGLISFTVSLVVLLYTQVSSLRDRHGRYKSCYGSVDCAMDPLVEDYLEADSAGDGPQLFTQSKKRSLKPVKCEQKYKWSECFIRFDARSSSVGHREVSVRVNGKELLSWSAQGIFLVMLDNKCHLVAKVSFLTIGRATTYYNALPRGTLLVGVATGLLGEIIHDKFGQVNVKEDETSDENIYPFVVKKEYDGIGNHSVIPAKGPDATWRFKIAIGIAYPITTANTTYMELVKKYHHLKPGGYHSNRDCVSVNRIAIIVPYRKREEQLLIFLNNVVGFLIEQHLVDFTIFIVEQSEPEVFNRAALMNIGYLEAAKLAQHGCYAFHDVDLLPEDLTNSYSCSPQPRHLVLGRDLHSYRLRYPEYFGGAVMMTPDTLEKINGFCNYFFGWGGEDDNTYLRVQEAGLQIQRFPASVATYVMLPHGRDSGNPRSGRKSPFGLQNTGQKKKGNQESALGYEDIWQDSMKSKADGLSTVNYTLLGIEKRHMYTHIYVRIPGPTALWEDTKPEKTN